jgi:hypothetical protein
MDRHRNGAAVMTLRMTMPGMTMNIANRSGLMRIMGRSCPQQTPILEPDQTLRIFDARSETKHNFAAVLVERGGKRSWMAVAPPDQRISGQAGNSSARQLRSFG